MPAPLYIELPWLGESTRYILLANNCEDKQTFGVFDFGLLRYEGSKLPDHYRHAIVWVNKFGASHGFNIAVKHPIVQKLNLTAGTVLLCDVIPFERQTEYPEFSTKAIVFAKGDQTTV